MTKENKFLVAGFLGLGALAFAAAVVPITSAQTTQSAGSQTAQTQTVSGKIASVSKSSFTLSIGSTVSSGAQSDSGKTMTFTIDTNTTISGKVRVGAKADVTYREVNGQNLAVNVNVTE